LAGEGERERGRGAVEKQVRVLKQSSDFHLMKMEKHWRT
jgi:hypothetical protein